MKKISQLQKGFTLVEMLTVMLIFGVVGSIAGSILVSSLRTSNKTSIVTNVKQNGDSVLSQMSKVIRTSKALIAPFPCVTPQTTKSLTVIASDGNQIIYSCLDSAPTPVPPSFNTISSNSASLLDTNTVAIIPNTCAFTCTQANTSDYPLIDITFYLTQKSTSTLVEQRVNSVFFNTSVTMRNLNRSL